MYTPLPLFPLPEIIYLIYNFLSCVHTIISAWSSTSCVVRSCQGGSSIMRDWTVHILFPIHVLYGKVFELSRLIGCIVLDFSLLLIHSHHTFLVHSCTFFSPTIPSCIVPIGIGSLHSIFYHHRYLGVASWFCGVANCCCDG